MSREARLFRNRFLAMLERARQGARIAELERENAIFADTAAERQNHIDRLEATLANVDAVTDGLNKERLNRIAYLGWLLHHHESKSHQGCHDINDPGPCDCECHREVRHPDG